MPGDGISDSSKVYEAAEAAAKRFIAFDMADARREHRQRHLGGPVRRAGRLGRAAVPARGYEATIRAAGIGIEPSLRAFAAGFDRTVADAASSTPPVPPKPASAGKLYPALAPIGDAAFDALVAEARTTFPAPLHGMIAAGMRKVADFQDVRYAREYLDLVAGFLTAGARRRSRFDAGGRQTHRGRDGL